MKRLATLALAVPAVLVAGLALGPGHARAGEKDEEQKKVEKQVVVRHAGGGRLGVSLADTEGDVRGAKVRSVEEGSAAEKAGIKEDDLIVRFDGEAVRSASHLARLVGETPAGRAVPIEVTRGGATQKLTATLAEGNRRVRVYSRGLPGMREFDFDVPEWDVEVPEPPAPPHAPSSPHAPMLPTPHASPRADASPRARGAPRLVLEGRRRERHGLPDARRGTAPAGRRVHGDRRAARVLLQAPREDRRPGEHGGRGRPGGQGRDEGRRRDPEGRHRGDRGRRGPARGGGRGRGRPGGHGDRPARRPARST